MVTTTVSRATDVCDGSRVQVELNPRPHVQQVLIDHDSYDNPMYPLAL
jgi:hypothetical protein